MNTQIAIVLITAILAPVIIKLVDLFISYKQKKLECMYVDKVKKYTALSDAYGKLYKSIDKNQKREFVALVWSAVLICDKHSRNLLLDFLVSFEANNDYTSEELDKLFSSCIESLSSDIKSSNKVLGI